MNEAIFWSLIEISRRETSGILKQSEMLIESLLKFEPEEILAIEVILRRLIASAYRWDLWAVICIAYDGSDNDDFQHFRAWLVSHGKEVFEKCLSDSQYAADLVIDVLPSKEPIYESFEFIIAPCTAFEKRTKESFYEALPGFEDPKTPSGEEFDEENVQLVYPEIAKRFDLRLEAK